MTNEGYLFGGSSGFSEEFLYEPRYKDKQRVSLSEASFLKSASAVGSRHTLNKRNSDQRNLSADLIKRESMKTLLRYLSWQEYPSTISFNDLQTPHRSLLISLWNFILKRVDESIEINTKNANEEVPRIFKELGYPLAISKSSMVAPGTGHQWSHHLAALCWLCELLIYENAVFPSIAQDSVTRGLEIDTSFGTSLFNSNHTDPTTKNILISTVTLNKLVSKSFIPCVIGKENKDTIKNAVLSQLEMDLDSLRGVHERKAYKMKELDTKFKQFESILQDHNRKASDIPEIQKECSQLDEQIEETRKQFPLAEKRIKMIEKSIFTKSKELETESNVIQQLNETLSKQKLSHEEVHQLKKKIQEHQDSLLRHQDAINLIEEDVANKTEKIKHIAEEIEELCLLLNKKLTDSIRTAEKVKSPSKDQWINILAFKFKQDAPSADKMLNVEWKKQKDLLKNLVSEENNYYQQIQSEVSNSALPSYQNKLKSLIENVEALVSEDKELRNKLRESEDSMKEQFQDIIKEKEELNKKLKVEESELRAKIHMSKSHFNELQENLTRQIELHFQQCIDKWENIENMCKDLTQAKIDSIDGFQRLVELKSEKLKISYKTNENSQ